VVVVVFANTETEDHDVKNVAVRMEYKKHDVKNVAVVVFANTEK
jgi:hypothetical protein